VNQESRVTDVAPNDGYWHHVVITWSSIRGNWKLYVDGLLNDSGFDLSTAKPVPGPQIMHFILFYFILFYFILFYFIFISFHLLYIILSS
jgi:hypothetical protein